MTKIHLLVGIGGVILVVFHTNAKCWQFQIVSSKGSILGERKIYYSAQAAEGVGREWIKQGRRVYPTDRQW
ncbi:MAG: hypothetical protein ACRCZS_13055 [Chroococcidiopsis sp.]